MLSLGTEPKLTLTVCFIPFSTGSALQRVKATPSVSEGCWLLRPRCGRSRPEERGVQAETGDDPGWRSNKFHSSAQALLISRGFYS
jgi:hypothetical protein